MIIIMLAMPLRNIFALITLLLTVIASTLLVLDDNSGKSTLFREFVNIVEKYKIEDFNIFKEILKP